MLTFLSLDNLCIAQEIGAEATLDTLTTNIKAPTVNVDSLLNVISVKDSLIAGYQTEISRNLVSSAAQNDTIASLREALNNVETKYNALLQDVEFADQCMMALAYRRCNEVYNEESVKRALGYFNRLHGEDAANKYAGLKKTLSDYADANREIKLVLTAAQDDPDRRDNPFVADEYRKKYISQIKSTMFYQDYIEKKPDFKLKYLETLTEEALGRLEKHDGMVITDFTDILDKLPQ